MNLWDSLVIFVSGKRLGLLGERGVGKTVLNLYLREGRLVRDYKQTVRAERVKGARPEVTPPSSSHTGRLAIRRGRDVPGDSTTNIDAWRDGVLESSYLLYLFNAHRLLQDDGTHGRRIVAQCETIKGFLEDRRSAGDTMPEVAMLGTHCDLDPRYVSPTKGTKSYKFYKAVRDRPEIDRACLVLGSELDKEPPVVVGSLISKVHADDLVGRIFHQEFELFG